VEAPPPADELTDIGRYKCSGCPVPDIEAEQNWRPHMVKTANVRFRVPKNFSLPDTPTLQNNDILELARPLHCYWHRSNGWTAKSY
jgi:hypothetical protein